MQKYTEIYGRMAALTESNDQSNNSIEEAIKSLVQSREAMNVCIAFMVNPAVAIHLNEFLYDRLLNQIRDCSQGLFLSVESLKGGSGVIGLEATDEAANNKNLS